jgi:hypothetical protein
VTTDPLPPARSTRRWLIPWVLVGLVAVVVGAEFAARGLAPYLPEPDTYGDQARAVKVAQLESRDGCTDVVVAGNSMARDGLVPSAITDADPERRSVYNAALDAATPELVADWLAGEVIGRTGAPVVVVAVSTLDLNIGAPGTAAAYASWTASVAGAEGILGDAGRWMASRSALVAHRSELRQPASVVDAVRRWHRGEPAERTSAESQGTVLGPDGEGRSRQNIVDSGDPVARRFVSDQLLADYDLGASPGARLADMVKRLEAEGTTVALVLLPTAPAFAELHPGGEADLDELADVVTSAAGDSGALLIDLRDIDTGPAGFADTHHLNAQGAAAVSRALPGALSAAGLPVRRCVP